MFSWIVLDGEIGEGTAKSIYVFNAFINIIFSCDWLTVYSSTRHD